MISGIANGGILVLQPQSKAPIYEKSSKKGSSVSPTSKTGNTPSVASQTSNSLIRTQGSIVSSLLNY